MSSPVSQIIDSDENLYVTGNEWIDNTKQIYTLKINWEGTIEWVKKYSDPESMETTAYKIISDKSGNLIVIGNLLNNSSGINNVLIKYDSTGNLLWLRKWTSPGMADDSIKRHRHRYKFKHLYCM